MRITINFDNFNLLKIIKMNDMHTISVFVELVAYIYSERAYLSLN